MIQKRAKKGFFAVEDDNFCFEGYSLKNFTLNDLEKDVIVKHMWPLTIKFPKYKESYIVTFVDKYCATVEFFKYLNKKYKLRMVYRYAYIFLTILFVRF